MPIIATGIQTRWKDCFASSERVKLTLRTNGEEATYVIDPYGSMVQAGFNAPTVVPSLAVSAGGSLTAGWYGYRYVYASTNYPNVDNAVTVADGELWPRSNPSSRAVAQTTGGNLIITITVTKTTRSDVDKILVYRTERFTTQAAAENAADAGEMFYIANVDNNGIAGTTTVTDNGLTDTGELLETDNYTAPTAWFCVFDGTYWWAAGNPEFTATATLNGTNTITITGPPYWFDGRNTQKVTFDGINSGGYDGRGTFYFKWISGTVGELYNDTALTVASTMPYTGTTTVHIQGFAATLYRSKPYNPFSWGYTQQIVNDDAATTNTPQTFALLMGGGFVCAMAVAGNPRKLKIDFENPQKAIAYDLEVADDIDALSRSAQDIDLTGSVTSHFSQFHGFLGNDPVLFGLDTYNGNILAFTGTQHVIVSDLFGTFLLNLDRSDDAHRWFHGQYDPETELNCFWVRYYDTLVRNNIMLWIHSSTQEAGWTPDFDVLSSCTLLDSETSERYLLGGTTNGNIGQLFDPDTNVNWTDEMPWKNNSLITGSTYSSNRYLVDVGMDLDSPTKYAQAVSSYNASAGTFVTTATPNFVVGDAVLLVDNPPTGAAERTVTVISGSNVTVNLPFTGIAPEYAMATFQRVDSQWATIQNPDGTDEWFVSIFSGEHDGDQTAEIQVDQYIHRGTTTVVTPINIPAPWPNGSRIIFGCIPCYYLAYFNLGTPTSNKRAREAWITAGNVETATQAVPFSFADTLSGRYYAEYDDEGTATNTFLCTVNKRQGGTVNSFTFARKDAVPSFSLPQFGFEVAEIGTGPFVMYDWTFKLKQDS